MPSGKTHQKATKIAILPAIGLTYGIITYYFPQLFDPAHRFIYSLWVGIGVWSGLHIHPDLDLLESSIKSKIRRGNIIQKYWWYRWWAYAKMADHRSPLSHSLLFSTIFRIIYISLEPALILCIFTDHFQSTVIIYFVISWALGLLISDSIHILMDSITTWYKVSLRPILLYCKKWFS